MAPLLALIVFLGVYPKPLLDRIEPSVDRARHPRRAATRDYRQPKVATDGPSAVQTGGRAR